MKRLFAVLISIMLLVPFVASAVEYDPSNVHLDGTLPIVADNTEMEPMTIRFIYPLFHLRISNFVLAS